MVVLGALVFAMTSPGQSAGVSVFIDPVMDSLSISRSSVSVAYLFGTLGGAAMLPAIGRAVDRHGVRHAMAAIGVCLGITLLGLSRVQGVLGLAIGFLGIRMLGQGALAIAALNTVAAWYDRRRGTAVGIASAFGAALLGLAPIAVAIMVDRAGWRAAWVMLGVLVMLLVPTLALKGIIQSPSDVGQQVDGATVRAAVHSGDTVSPSSSYSRHDALRSPMFWAITSAVAVTGMITTGLIFHQIDVLGEQGLEPVEAAINFLPQTAAMLTVTVIAGRALDSLPLRMTVVGAMALMITTMLLLPNVLPGPRSYIYGIVLGATGALALSLESAAVTKIFGLREIGAIRGVMTGVGNMATALGPLALSIGYDLTGSYRSVLLALILLPIAVLLFALIAPMPVGRGEDPREILAA